MNHEQLKRQAHALQEARVAAWVSETKTMAKELISGDRPGAGALLKTVLAFVIGGHVDDVELSRLAAVLSSAGIDAFQDREKDAS